MRKFVFDFCEICFLIFTAGIEIACFFYGSPFRTFGVLVNPERVSRYEAGGGAWRNVNKRRKRLHNRSIVAAAGLMGN